MPGIERANMSNAFVSVDETGMGDFMYNLPGSSKGKVLPSFNGSVSNHGQKKSKFSRSNSAAKKWENFASNLSERYTGDSESTEGVDVPVSIDTFEGDHTPANGNSAEFSCFMQEPFVLDFNLKEAEREDPGEYYDSWDRTDLENDFIEFAFTKGIPLDFANDYEFEEFLVRVYQQLYPNSKAILFWDSDTFEKVEKRVLKEYLLLKYKIIAEDSVYEKLLDLSIEEIKLCVLERPVTLDDVDFFLSHYELQGFQQKHYFKYSLDAGYNELIFSLESNNCFDAVQVLNYYRNFDTFKSYVNRKLNGESFDQDVCVYPELMQKLLEHDYAFGDVTQGMLTERSKSIDLFSEIVLADDFDFEFLNSHNYKVTTIVTLAQRENLIVDVGKLHANLIESIYDAYIGDKILYQDIFVYLQIDEASIQKKNLQLINFIGSYEVLPPIKQLVHDYVIYFISNAGFFIKSGGDCGLDILSVIVNKKPLLTLHYLEFIEDVEGNSAKLLQEFSKQASSSRELFIEPLDSANGYAIVSVQGEQIKAVYQNDKLLCSLQAWIADLGRHKFAIELQNLDSYNLYYLLDSTMPVKGSNPDIIADKEGTGIDKNSELGKTLREQLKELVKNRELSSKLDNVFYYFRDSNQEIITKSSFIKVASSLLYFKFVPNNKRMYAGFFMMVCKRFFQHLIMEQPQLSNYSDSSDVAIIVTQANSVIFNGSFSQFLRTFEAFYRRLDAYKNQAQKHSILLRETSVDDLVIDVR